MNFSRLLPLPSSSPRSAARLLLALATAGCFPAATHAQTPPAEVPGSAAPTHYVIEHFGAQGAEKVVLARLTGVKFVPGADQVVREGVTLTGVDTASVPLLNRPEFALLIRPFLDVPASMESLQRIVTAASSFLTASGYPFLTIYLPAQDITTGTVQVIVAPASRADEIKVEGARYFSADSYRAGIRQPAAGPINTIDLKADLDWLNRNPFRRVTSVARPGKTVGSTELVLRVEERFPWRFSAGYNNTGSLVSDEDRLTAGIAWGNAFGRGDQMDYLYSASPDGETSVSHSLNYTSGLPWRHTLRFSGAYSELTGRVAAPLALSGRNAQATLRYEIPLAPLSPKVTQGLSLGLDFKASDNNLLFAAFPITDNLTHIVQFNASYSLGFTDRLGRTDVSATVFASPGGLTSRNHTSYFDISRTLAKPEYAYAQFNAARQQRLPLGLACSARGLVQLATGNLLGSEQMAGGGSSSVRGYEEGEGFGDAGAFFSHEVALPPQSLAKLFKATKWSDSLQLFAFQDLAVFRSIDRLPGERKWTDLHSVGLGLRYQVQSFLSINVTHGWQLRESGVSRSGDNSRTHLSAQASF